MMTKLVLALASTAIAAASAEVFFQENFNDAAWESRWVASEWKPSSEVGAFSHVSGAHFADADDKAIKTSEDARFYALSAKFAKPLNNKGKDLYLSYLVQHEQSIDCGGAYIKLLPASLDQSKFGGDSPYAVMFGPDICGSTRKTHAILNYVRPGKDAVNMDHKGELRAESDSDAHLYAFVLKQDNTYDVLIDGKSVQTGELATNWPFQPEKTIKDPSQSKPADWVDEKMMADPSDEKPAGWDDVPRTIPDPDAEKPEDWDEEDDGEWEPATIENPEYKGEWQPKLIENPAYKGEWEHPMIANPDFFEDAAMYNVAKDVGAIGFELWQVKSGTLFDDILVTDDAAAFKAHEEEVLSKIAAANEKKKAAEDAERKAREEEAAKKAAEAEAEAAAKKEAAAGSEDDDEKEDAKSGEAEKADEKDEL
jgi:calreticulin